MEVDGETVMEVGSQLNSPLLNLPVELALKILEHVPPESSVAFSLTCRFAFFRFFHQMKQRLEHAAEPKLLMLLEEGQSHKLFFCHQCNRYHTLDPAWTRDPGPDRHTQGHTGLGSAYCSNRTMLPCTSKWLVPKTYAPGPLGLCFHHAKLATNAHVWGSGHGMDLTWLSKENPGFNYWQDQDWKTGYSARISPEGQLFLRVTHKGRLTYRGRRDGVLGLPIVGYFICHHVGHGIFVFEGQRTVRKMIPELDPSRGLTTTNSPGSCGSCLTDYTTTIKERTDRPKSTKASHGKYYDIDIVSYHQLGACRSPSDPAWVAFATPSLVSINQDRQNPNFAPLQHEPGTIRRQWERCFVGNSESHQAEATTH